MAPATVNTEAETKLAVAEKHMIKKVLIGKCKVVRKVSDALLYNFNSKLLIKLRNQIVPLIFYLICILSDEWRLD